MFNLFNLPYERVKGFGKQILGDQKVTALDIGGAAGLQSHWNRLIGNAKIVMYEPHEESYKELLDMYATHPCREDFIIVQDALSGTGGKRNFYLMATPTASTIVPYNYDNPEIKIAPSTREYKVIEINTVTLKDSLDKEGISSVDMMKLDIQGGELEVITGMDSQRLSNVLMIESEVDASYSYKNGTTYEGMQNYLKEHGLILYDVRVSRKYRRTEDGNAYISEKYFNVSPDSPSIASRINEYDVVYFRDPQLMITSGDEKQIRRACFAYCVYNFFPEVTYLLNLAREETIIDKAVWEEVQYATAQWHKAMQEVLQPFEQLLHSFNNHLWLQYSLRPYPSL